MGLPSTVRSIVAPTSGAAVVPTRDAAATPPASMDSAAAFRTTLDRASAAVTVPSASAPMPPSPAISLPSPVTIAAAPTREVAAGSMRPAAERPPVSTAIAPTSTSMATWTSPVQVIPARTARSASRPTLLSPATTSVRLTTIAAVRSRGVAVAGTVAAVAGCAAATMAFAPARPHPVVTAKDATATSMIRTRALLVWSAARCKVGSSAPPGLIAGDDASFWGLAGVVAALPH
jgi:hypothetical protein